jgi:hypothetical protein
VIWLRGWRLILKRYFFITSGQGYRLVQPPDPVGDVGLNYYIQMLNGNPASIQRFSAPSLAGFPFQALIPSELDGVVPPPIGSPNYFIRHRDDENHNPSSNDPTMDFFEI